MPSQTSCWAFQVFPGGGGAPVPVIIKLCEYCFGFIFYIIILCSFYRIVKYIPCGIIIKCVYFFLIVVVGSVSGRHPRPTPLLEAKGATQWLPLPTISPSRHQPPYQQQQKSPPWRSRYGKIPSWLTLSRTWSCTILCLGDTTPSGRPGRTAPTSL